MRPKHLTFPFPKETVETKAKEVRICMQLEASLCGDYDWMGLACVCISQKTVEGPSINL